VPAKKATAKAAPRVSSRVASHPRMTTARRTATTSGHTAMPVSRACTPTMPAQPGDFVVIDSRQAGALPREGEVLEVIQGRADRQPPDPMGRTGHQSLIAPRGGTARKVRASQRA
jgi:hypothetical protein